MEQKNRVILILNIKIDSDRTEDLIIHENDEPEVLSDNFCIRHMLPDNVKEVLTKHIEDNLDSFIEEEIGNSTTKISSIGDSQIKPLNFSQNIHKRSNSAKNYGEFLYNKGILMKQKVENMVQIQKQSLLEKEMKNSTFKPKISNYKGRERNEGYRYEKQRKINQFDPLNNCTFKPKINSYRSNSRDTKNKVDKCVELYNNAKLLKQKKEEKSQKL